VSEGEVHGKGANVTCRICGTDVGVDPRHAELGHSYYCSISCYEGGTDAIAGTRSTIAAPLGSVGSRGGAGGNDGLGASSPRGDVLPPPRNRADSVSRCFFSPVSTSAEERVAAIRRGDPEAIRAWTEDVDVCHSELGRAALRGLIAVIDEQEMVTGRYALDRAEARARSRDRRQAEVAAWVERVFGAESLATEERALRFVEEAVELAQASGLSAERVRAVAEHVYARPTGEVAREVGGVGVTLIALCAVLGVSAEDEEAAEVARVFAVDPEHMRERNERKVAVGIAVAARRGGGGGET